MTRVTHHLRTLMPLIGTLLSLLCDGLCFLCLCPIPALAAENLFLRKQLALYQERHIKPQRATDATRLSLVWLARWFDWRQALAVVQHATFTSWHRLDLMIPLTERYLHRILHEWVDHYHAGRPHMALGPGIPQPPSSPSVPRQRHRHRLPEHLQVVSHAILGGLHQEYWLEEKAA